MFSSEKDSVPPFTDKCYHLEWTAVQVQDSAESQLKGSTTQPMVRVPSLLLDMNNNVRQMDVFPTRLSNGSRQIIYDQQQGMFLPV